MRLPGAIAVFTLFAGSVCAQNVTPYQQADANDLPSQQIVGEALTESVEDSNAEVQQIKKRFSVAVALGIRSYAWDEFEQQGLLSVNPLAGLKFSMHIRDFWAVEASILPSMVAGNFSENEKHFSEKAELFIPISLNLLVKPSFANGRFSPFVTLGAGPGVTSFKLRTPNPNANPLYFDPARPATIESHYADGLGFQVNPGVGAELRVSKKWFAGLDIRYFFMTIKKSVIDVKELEAMSNAFAYRLPIQKDFKYDNGSIFLYAGIDF